VWLLKDLASVGKLGGWYYIDDVLFARSTLDALVTHVDGLPYECLYYLLSAYITQRAAGCTCV